MDGLVYDQPHHRAAAPFHSLCRVPTLEHSNALLGVTVAASYLHASGRSVRFTAKEAADLAEQATAGTTDIRALADTLKEWTERA